jgi:pyrroloquinoline quinone biosynthesis protein D
MSLAEDVIPKLPHGVRLREDKVRGRWVLLAPERVIEPDDIAVEIIKRCDGSATLGAVIDDLARTFEADRATVANDVKTVVAFLSERRMIDL